MNITKWEKEIASLTSSSDKSKKFSVCITEADMEIIRRCKCLGMFTVDDFEMYVNTRINYVNLVSTLDILVTSNRKRLFT